MKLIVSAVLGLMLLGQNTLGWAASDSEESTPEQIGYGTGSVLGSAVYFPFKASFCILGGISSGFALVFGRPFPWGELRRTGLATLEVTTAPKLDGEWVFRRLFGRPFGEPCGQLIWVCRGSA